MGEFLEYLATKSGMADALRVLLTTDEGLRLRTRSLLVDACDRLLRAAEAAGDVRPGVEALDVVMALGGFAFSAEEQAQAELRDRLLGLLLNGVRP